MPRFLALPSLLVLLAACQPVVVLPVEPDGGTGATDTCGATALASLVGEGAGILDSARFSQPVRVIRPGEMVTMDYNPARLNFRIGPDGRIAEVTCG